VLFSLNIRNVFIVMLLLGIAYFQYRLWVGEGSFENLSSIQQQIDDRRGDNDILIERNQRLAEEVKALKSGSAAIEQRARTDLGMVKENETFYLIVNDKKSDRK
jgi:cell division protein FtsB